jgi:hypothetical protein
VSSSPTSNPDRTSRPILSDVSHHGCGCTSKGISRLQSTSGDLRSIVGRGTPEADTLETVLNVAVIGGAAYLVYKLFFD